MKGIGEVQNDILYTLMAKGYTISFLRGQEMTMARFGIHLGRERYCESERSSQNTCTTFETLTTLYKARALAMIYYASQGVYIEMKIPWTT